MHNDKWHNDIIYIYIYIPNEISNNHKCWNANLNLFFLKRMFWFNCPKIPKMQKDFVVSDYFSVKHPIIKVFGEQVYIYLGWKVFLHFYCATRYGRKRVKKWSKKTYSVSPLIYIQWSINYYDIWYAVHKFSPKMT